MEELPLDYCSRIDAANRCYQHFRDEVDNNDNAPGEREYWNFGKASSPRSMQIREKEREKGKDGKTGKVKMESGGSEKEGRK